FKVYRVPDKKNKDRKVGVRKILYLEERVGRARRKAVPKIRMKGEASKVSLGSDNIVRRRGNKFFISFFFPSQINYILDGKYLNNQDLVGLSSTSTRT